MHILLMECDLQIHGSHSLKDKRSVLKRIIDRLRTSHNVSVAEIDHHDVWQRASIAIITVSMIQSRTEKTLRDCLHEIEQAGDVEILADERTWL